MAEEDTGTDTIPPLKAKRKGARASLHVEGEATQATVDDVLAAAGGGKGRTSTASKTAPPIRFEKAIRDPNNKIIAKRLQPTVTLEGEPLGDEFHDLLPHDRLTLDEIKKDLAESRGGRKWHVKVEDPDGKIVAAETINVPGEPKLEPGFDETGGGGGMGSELGEEETLEEQLEKDPDIVRMRKDERMMELETRKLQRQAELDAARAQAAAAKRALDAAQNPGQQGANGNGHKSEESKFAEMIEKANAPLKAALAASEKSLDEERARNRSRDEKAERKADLEAVTAPLKAAQDAQAKTLEALLQKMNQPVMPTGPTTDALMAKLDAVKSDLRSDFKDQINTVVNGIRDGLTSKIDTLASTVNLLMAKGNDPVTAAMLQLATKSGAGGPAQQDPFTMMAKAMETMKALQAMTNKNDGAPQDFPSYLVDRVTSLAPDVMEFIKEQQANAQVVTKDVMEAKMKELGTKMWQGLDQTIKAEIRNIRVTPSVNTPTPAPASAATAGPPPPPVKPTPAPSGVGATPPAAAPAPGGGPPPPTPAPAPAAAPGANVPPTSAYPFGMTQEDFLQTKKRVGHVLKILYGEMRLGVQAFKWPEQAFAHLPKPIIDALVPAETDVQIRDIIEPFAEAQMMQDIWAYLSDSHPQHEWYRKWLTDGINWIKDAAADQGSEEGEPVVDEP